MNTFHSSLHVSRERFNVLLCDEAEYFLESYSASWVTVPRDADANALHQHCTSEQVDGSVKVCSRGVFFVPDDAMYPVMKWPYLSMVEAPVAGDAALQELKASEQLRPADVKATSAVLQRSLVFHAHQAVEMKQNNVIGRYRFVDVVNDGAAASKSPSSGKRMVASPKGGSGSGSTDSSTNKGGIVKSLFGGLGSFLGKGKDAGEEGKKAQRTPTAGKGKREITVEQCPMMIITLTHTLPAKVVPLTAKLWRLQRDAKGKMRGAEADMLRPLLEARETSPFDLGCLGDFREAPLLSEKEGILVDRVLPLLHCPGRVMITNRAVYFQPCPVNNVGESVSRWSLSELNQVVGRRYLMRSTGIEVVPRNGNPVLLACSSVRGRRVLMAAFHKAQEVVKHTSKSRAMPAFTGYSGPSTFLLLGTEDGRDHHDEKEGTEEDEDLPAPRPLLQYLDSLVRRWQQREISNFEYLMELNNLADRTTNDLAQYPVFPWIIADYESPTLDFEDPRIYRDLSKPIGALTEDRLEMFRERFREMPKGEGLEAPFLYGTHYSAPGYVLYYMVRKAPEHMLRLQSGKFDAPDRLFNNIASTWKGVCTNPADLKELIPEFYEGAGDFLMNAKNLDLGTKQDGEKVGDVELPPWAYDHTDFVVKCRRALESDYVSSHIHEWIDLIFGAKQRGPAAVKANNVFHPITYQGTVDLDTIEDERERQGMQAQLAEFGQVPKQLFYIPHPTRNATKGLGAQEKEEYKETEREKGKEDKGGSKASTEPSGSQGKEGSMRAPDRHSEQKGDASGDEVSLISDATDGEEEKQGDAEGLRVRSPPTTPPRQPPLPSKLQSPRRQVSDASQTAAVPEGALVVGKRKQQLLSQWQEWDPLQLKGRGIERVEDAVVAESSIEVQGEVVKQFQYVGHEQSLPGTGRIFCLRIHKGNVSSMTLMPSRETQAAVPYTLLTTSHDKTIRCFDLARGRQTKAHSNGGVHVAASCLGPGVGTFVCGCADGAVKVFKTSSGSFTQSMPTAHSQAISAVQLSPDGTHLATGSWDSHVKIWQVVDNTIEKEPVYEFRNHHYPVTKLAWSPRGDYLVSADMAGILVFYDMYAGQRECSQDLLKNIDGLGPLTTEDMYGVSGLAWGDARHIQRALHPLGVRHRRASTKQSMGDELISDESSVEESETPELSDFDLQGVPTGTRFNLEDWLVVSTVEGTLAVFAYDGKYLGSVSTGEVIRALALDSWGLFAFTGGSRGVVRMWDLSPLLVASGNDDSFIAEIELYNTPDTLCLTLPRATVASDKAGSWVKTKGKEDKGGKEEEEEGGEKKEGKPRKRRSSKGGVVARSIKSMESIAEAAAGGGVVTEYNANTLGTTACWLSSLSVLDSDDKTIVVAGDVEGSISVWRRENNAPQA